MTVARRFSALRCAAVTVTLLAASAAHGKATAPPFLQVAGVIDAPHGFVEMCKSDSSFCARSRTQADRGNSDDTVARDLLPMSVPSLSMVSVPFHIDATFLRLVIGADSLGALSAGVPMTNAEASGLPGMVIATGQPARASPLMSCPSLSGSFGAKDDALLPEMPAPLSVRDLAAGFPRLKFGQLRNLFALPATCRQGGGISRLALLDTGAIAPALPPPVASPAPSQPPRVASANEADEQTLLQGINRLVNGRVHQRTDLEIYGQAEVWRRSGVGKGATGDCEDLAIEKRFELVDAGFAPDRLAFAVVYAHGVGLHTVLVAHLSSGDYVLDSRTPYVQPWAETPYSWIGIQSIEDPMAWHAVMGSGRKT